MAHITNTLQPRFTGHVGPVRFTDGHADCDDTDLVAYFLGDPDRYAVDDVTSDPEDPEGDPEDPDDVED